MSIEFAQFMTAQAETKAARERYNYASTALEIAQIRERLAEMRSQHEPLAALRDAALSERDKLYAAAHYVVVGRMPDCFNKKG
jgi:hypothetical protein